MHSNNKAYNQNTSMCLRNSLVKGRLRHISKFLVARVLFSFTIVFFDIMGYSRGTKSVLFPFFPKSITICLSGHSTKKNSTFKT